MHWSPRLSLTLRSDVMTVPVDCTHQESRKHKTFGIMAKYAQVKILLQTKRNLPEVTSHLISVLDKVYFKLHFVQYPDTADQNRS